MTCRARTVLSPDHHGLMAKDGLEQLHQILGLSVERLFHSKGAFVGTNILFKWKRRLMLAGILSNHCSRLADHTADCNCVWTLRIDALHKQYSSLIFSHVSVVYCTLKMEIGSAHTVNYSHYQVGPFQTSEGDITAGHQRHHFHEQEVHLPNHTILPQNLVL